MLLLVILFVHTHCYRTTTLNHITCAYDHAAIITTPSITETLRYVNYRNSSANTSVIHVRVNEYCRSFFVPTVYGTLLSPIQMSNGLIGGQYVRQ
jgi:hypothetical protein